MRILAFDLEATGLDTSKDKVIEVGMVLWDSDRNTPLQVSNMMVSWDNIEITPQVQQLTGIFPSDLKEFGQPAQLVAEQFLSLAEKADVLMAHNGLGYDVPMMQNFLAGFGKDFPDKVLVDTMIDLPLDKSIKQRNLKSLLTDHEILNYFPHRAFADALCMAKMASRYPMVDILARAETKYVKVVARVSYDDRQKAKDAGFYWAPENRQWFKNMRTFDYKPDSFEFPTEVLEIS